MRLSGSKTSLICWATMTGYQWDRIYLDFDVRITISCIRMMHRHIRDVSMCSWLATDRTVEKLTDSTMAWLHDEYWYASEAETMATLQHTPLGIHAHTTVSCSLRHSFHTYLPPPHNNRFTTLLLGPPGWAGARTELLDFMVQGKINRDRHTDHLAGHHSIRTNQCPPPPSPPFFYRLDALPAAQPTVSKHWRQLAHLDQGEDTRVLLNGVTYAASVPSHILKLRKILLIYTSSLLLTIVSHAYCCDQAFHNAYCTASR